MFLLTWLLCRFEAWANPVGGTVTQGHATFSTSGTQFTINQTSGNAYINWQSFNIGVGETTTFNQPSANSITWNQINDVNPSQILGNLNANGYVVLQNANGFYIGGQAAITTHGLVLTTAQAPVNLSSGGPWSFNTPPPAAKIQNYGQINITGGGTAYLIAADIVNGGTISAPNGHIGLFDGETVLVSTAPNGQGLSAQVTLPQGSVDNEGNLTANGGSVIAQAQMVNQNGVIQANAAQNVDGTIELVGSTVTLGANSAISATGDSTAAGTSAGGSVQIQAGTSFSDASGSSINVSGAAQGGNAGQISISAPQMAALNSSLNGQAAAGYLNGTLSINTGNIALNGDGSPVANALALDVNALSSGLSQINLQSSGDISLDAPWILAVNGGIPSSVCLQAANEIALTSGAKIQADGGSITLKAPTVDQAGTLQANSSGAATGVVEIDASQNLTLEGSSTINASGGFVVLNAGNAYSDASGSKISVAGGQGGVVEIFDPQAITTPILTAVSGAFAYLVNPYDLTLSGNATGTSQDSNNNLDANFNVNDLAAYSRIDLQALDNIELSTAWTLNDPGLPAVLKMTAGNNITVDDGSGISAGQNWSLNLKAGTGFVPTAAQPAPVSGSDGIYLDGSGFIQTQNGDINLWAANEVQVGWSGQAAQPGQVNPGTGGITTHNGGNINVTTRYGDVNTGSNPFGFTYVAASPYTISAINLGGISTGNGGNVNINAGGNVISYNPTGASIANDAGTGAFGTTQSGNVTITAGGSVYGHYVVSDGTGTIDAGQDAGAAAGNDFALSLINGGWSVNAPNGNIYLQEVRNPNALFNNAPGRRGQVVTPYLFTYGSQDFVDLNAYGVYLTDLSVPRLAGVVPLPVIYPSVLDITAGAGNVTLEGNVTLYPSPYQNLDITTTDGGSMVGVPNNPGTIPELLMSDSSQTRGNISGGFLDTDTGNVLPNELLNPNPVIIDISGYLGMIPDPANPGSATGVGLNIITTKETDITVGKSMINCGFSGQNLQASDVTSINVAGQIFNTSPYNFVYGIAIPNMPATDVPIGLANTWNTVLALAVNQTALDNLTLPANLTPSQYLSYALQSAGWFSQVVNGRLVPETLGFVYDPQTGRLGFQGQMSQNILSALTQPITVLHLVNGQPVINPATGKFETDTVAWVAPSVINSLNQSALVNNTPSPSPGQLGYQIGGPGAFDITAGSISLGNTYGILSDGVVESEGGLSRYGNLASITPVGATINILVTGSEQITDPLLPEDNQNNPYEASLDMLTSTIAALGGGDVNVTCTSGSMDLGSQELLSGQRSFGAGIYTTGGGNVNLIALGDVNIDGSRVGTYNGGDIFVESLTGTVNIGSGGNTVNALYVSYVNPITGQASYFNETAFGSGIVANTLIPPLPGGQPWPPNVARLPGNITVLAPQGDIISTEGGVLQEALNGNLSSGPTVTLEAGTPAGGDWSSAAPPVYIGNIDTGSSGVIAVGLVVHATGNVKGNLISRGNADVTAGQNFTGTLLAGGSASLGAGGDVSGTIVGIGSVTITGGAITASVLSQNANVGGQQSDTLGSSAGATSSSMSAAQQGNAQAKQQLAADELPQQDNQKKKSQIRKVGRVTVVLAAAQ